VCNAINNIVEPDSAKAHEHDKELRKNNRLGEGGGGGSSRAGVGVDSIRGGAAVQGGQQGKKRRRAHHKIVFNLAFCTKADAEVCVRRFP
jgi:hypothetical protein